jgi:hypothetical protein
LRAGPRDLAARRAAAEAFGCDGTAAQIAELFAASVTAARELEPGDGPLAVYRYVYTQMLAVLEQLYRWDGAIQAAEADSDRYLKAAKRQVELLAERLDDGDAGHEPLRCVLRTIVDIEQPDQITTVRSDAARVPLPMRMVGSPSTGAARHRGQEPDAPDPEPRVVVLLELGGQPISGPVLVDVNRAYALQIEARVIDWPAWAQQLSVRFLSRWQGSAATVPGVDLQRPDPDSDGIWRSAAQSGVTVHATSADPERPLLFTVEAQMVGPDRSESVAVLGYSVLSLLTYNPALDYITGSEVIDRRVYDVLREVNDSGIPEAERRAFSDLFKTLANEAQILVANNTFRSGTSVMEAEFQTRLLERAQSRLGATNVRTGAEVGGGEMDLVYLDTLTAELKVERTIAARLNNANRYLGQPTQYASATGRQLSILCILDLTERDTPVGVLANGIGLLKPCIPGDDAPTYPSLVGVIIVSAGLPLPSDWSGKPVPTA